MQMSALDELLPVVKCAEVLAQKYDVLVTNPPYLGSSRFSTKLNDFVIANYPDVKADLSMVMYKHALRDMCKKNGFVSFITTTSWMFLSSFEKLRSFVLAGYDFESLVDFGTELFEGKVGHNPIVAWVNRKSHTDHAMTGIRLVDYCYSRRGEKETEFFNKKNYHYPKQSNFSKIPGSPVAYWVSERMMSLFEYPDIKSMVLFRQGMATSDNNRFLRKWYEVSLSNFFASAKSLLEAKESARKWFPYNKGGEYRKWYGNHEYCVNWENDGQEMKAYTATLPQGMNVRLKSREYYFRPEISWSAVTSGNLSVRFYPCGFIFDTAGGCIFNCDGHEMFFLALLNAKIGGLVMDAINPTINNTLEDMKKIPVMFDSEAEISTMVRECVHISEIDWNSYETSWDFKRNPLV